jgi:hypothetical protein
MFTSETFMARSQVFRKFLLTKAMSIWLRVRYFVTHYRAMTIYRDVGFNGPFMMDHTPRLPQKEAGWAGKAYAIGYIRGLIQSVYA